VKILLRRMFPCPPVERWRKFETILKECLRELDHEVFELDMDNQIPPDPPEAEYKIYAHKTRREAPSANLFFKEMYMHHLFTLDHQGWGADDSRMRNAPQLCGVGEADADSFCAGLREEFLTSGKSKHIQPPLKEVDPGMRPYLLAPLQVPTDEVIRNHAPLSIIDFVHVLSDWAERRRQNLVFKLHPGRFFPEIAEVVERRVSSSPYLFLSPDNIHSLISSAQGVVVINSGTGFESLIHGKPVATVGACDYQWFTFRANFQDLDPFLDYVANYSPEQRLDGYKFVHFYYHEHAYLIAGEHLPGARERVMNFLRQAVPN
jgi:Capsule polysaccharide biosynthesis protein